MAAQKKKPTPRPKRRAPKKVVANKEDIEKHLRAINEALGIDETAEATTTSVSATTSEVHVSHSQDTIEEPPTSEPVAPEVEEPVEETSAEVPSDTPEVQEPVSEPQNFSRPVAPQSQMEESPETPEMNTIDSPQNQDMETQQPSIDDLGSTDTMEPEGEKGKKKLLPIILATIIVLAVVGGGIYLYNMMAAKQKANQAAEKKQAESEFKPEATATPTEEALGNLSEYTVQVLNGSGTAGEAANAADLLKDAGFSDINTGNAEQYDYTDTEVSLKKGAPEALFDEVKKALEGDYVVVQTAEELPTDSDWDIQVIIGSSTPDEAEEATPTEAEEE